MLLCWPNGVLDDQLCGENELRLAEPRQSNLYGRSIICICVVYVAINYIVVYTFFFKFNYNI